MISFVAKATAEYSKETKFISLEKEKILISANCIKKNRIKKCDASRAINEAKITLIQPDNFGRNPGALICKEQFKGEIILVRDNKGNETSFCKFKDQTMLSTGTLGYYANLNVDKK